MVDSLSISSSNSNGGLSRPQIFCLLLKFLQLCVAGTVGMCSLPMVWIGCRIYHRPPILPYWRQFIRYLGYVWWTANPTDPSFPPGSRVYLTMVVLINYFMSIIGSAAWILDEILYGKLFDEVSVNQPLFLLSSARSGSTQLARYLEEDPNLACPSLVMTMFPYLWLWKLVPKTIGRYMISQEQMLQKTLDMFPIEAQKRHEINPFKADTFDVAFVTKHFNSISLQLGPTIAALEFNFAEAAPHNKSLMENEYVQLIDRVAKKTLLYHGNNSDNQMRFLIKGHFLLSAPALSKQYPDCSMVTVVRDPCKRFRSLIHFFCVNPPDPFMGPIPWNWATPLVETTEVRYCEVEQEWFDTAEEVGVTKCVINFDDFINDPATAIATIYKECLGMDEVPSCIPTTHKSTNAEGKYCINHTLKELGLDEEALRRRLKRNIQWVESTKKST